MLLSIKVCKFFIEKTKLTVAFALNCKAYFCGICLENLNLSVSVSYFLTSNKEMKGLFLSYIHMDGKQGRDN